MIFWKTFDLFGATVQWIFWTIGYFFGFTLVSVMTLGFIKPEELFDRPQINNVRLFFRRRGSLYMANEAVSMTGWLFVIMFLWVINIV
ncbi:MAG: hypothetical protein AAF456_24850 [Planctomycetota bacterium]